MKTLLIIFTLNISKSMSMFTDNYTDSSGKKQGFWRYTNSNLFYEVYYVNDTFDGVYRSYYQNQKMSTFGIYKKGKMVGSWYYFDEEGNIYMEVSKISNKAYTFNEKFFYNYKSYIKIYNLYGSCTEEGFALYNDVEVSFEKILSTWKIY